MSLTPLIFSIVNSDASENHNIVFPFYGKIPYVGYEKSRYYLNGLDPYTKVSIRYLNNSWEQLANWLMTNQARINTIYMQSSNQSQLTTPIKLINNDVLSNRKEEILNPVLDPYQKQIGSVIVHTDFLFGRENALQIKILANTTLTLKLFPSSLGSAGKVEYYKMPNIVKKAKIR